MTTPFKGSTLNSRAYMPGQVIFSQGDPGEVAYVLASGAVDITKAIENQVVKVGTVKEGEIFGEMAVIDGSERMATAMATETTTVILIPKQVFEGEISKVDPFVNLLISMFLNNIRNAHKIYTRKPNDLKGCIKVILSLSHDLRTYTNNIESSDYSAKFAAKLAELDKTIYDLNEISLQNKDRRSDSIDVLDREIDLDSP